LKPNKACAVHDSVPRTPYSFSRAVDVTTRKAYFAHNLVAAFVLCSYHAYGCAILTFGAWYIL